MAPVGEMVLGLPDVRLRPFVDRYIGYRERADVPLVRRESAGVFVVLILGWGAPLDVTDPRSAERGATNVDSFVAGTFDGWCATRTMGVGEGVELLLAPLTARRLLGLPLSELTNRAVGVGQLPGRWLDQLRGRLAEAAGWPERFALLDRVLADRLAASPPVDTRLDWAWRWLVAGGGQEGVGALADELGWSRRHLASRFRKDVGLPPKMVARLLRFQQAYAALADVGATIGAGAGAGAGPPTDAGRSAAGAGSAGATRAVDWAEVAARCGYYDQSHLIRDFHEFAGATPAALLAARSMAG
ncbi:helix-turn-helix domain-containing protein [Micromonospora parathelypteridis]|uniref:AraC-like DNA-binding protein n=1 Tax=Micromonospora parathelypteridis TaxID=1839617 RepID=A0A840VZT3_9ACTN|nr:helix-turn-helix domain-containing protein [Micromonospora parathelypteridis]MBB5476491.1 AraC-like DNA-binding protein [Micromonospora parathelypteridis]